MTATEGKRTYVKIAEACKAFDGLTPQKINKAIRDGVLECSEKNGVRTVALEDVEAFLRGAGSRPRGREKGSTNPDNTPMGKLNRKRRIRETDFIVRVAKQEIIRRVDCVTGVHEEFFTTRGIVNCEPDRFIGLMRPERALELLENDQMLVLDRWAMVQLLAATFKQTGEDDIADGILMLMDEYKDKSEAMLAAARAKHDAELNALREKWLIDNGLKEEGDEESLPEPGDRYEPEEVTTEGIEL